MFTENINDALAVTDAAGIDFMSQNYFLAAIMLPRPEQELTAQLWSVNGPASERARHFLHVPLCVAAVNAEGVQFHQLAGVVFVDAFDGRREMVIKVEKHRGALRRCHQQILEFPEDMRANRVCFVAGRQPAVGILSPKDVEMVEPEIRHYFMQLAFAVNGADNLLRLKLQEDLLRDVEQHRPHLQLSCLAWRAIPVD